MRITLHAVHVDDYPAMHAAMVGALRASRLHDNRFRSSGLTIADVDELLPHLVSFAADPVTKDEIEGMLADRLGAPPHERLWWAMRTFAPLVHAPTGGPWSFGSKRSFSAAPTPPSPLQRSEAVRYLVLRYLEGFGPASIPDMSQFTLLPRALIRDALASERDGLQTFRGPDGTELFDVPGKTIAEEDVDCPPRLLPMWDSVLLAYADRSRVIPSEYRRVVIQRNGDVLPAVLVDGCVAGVWRATGEGIEVMAFHPLDNATWQAISEEASMLRAFLAERDPAVYRRYGRWWERLPPAEVRVLP